MVEGGRQNWERSGLHYCCLGPHPVCECGCLACYKSYIPVEGRENSWCIISEVLGVGSQCCFQGWYPVGEIERSPLVSDP